MKDVIFAIASYNRPDKQHFLRYLRGLGIPKSRIFIGTQCIRDREQYQELFGRDANILYREGENVCDNKNNLLNELVPTGAPIIVASDKVKGLQFYNGAKLHTADTLDTFNRLVSFGYSLAQRNRASVWGVYPTNNAYFMKRSASVDKMLLGCFMAFFPNTPLRFDRMFPIKEDFEISCNAIAHGMHTLRFNNLALDATFHQKGGSYELWHSEGDCVNATCCKRMLVKYPTLVTKHPTRKNELRFTGKSKTINF